MNNKYIDTKLLKYCRHANEITPQNVEIECEFISWFCKLGNSKYVNVTHDMLTIFFSKLLKLCFIT